MKESDVVMGGGRAPVKGSKMASVRRHARALKLKNAPKKDSPSSPSRRQIANPFSMRRR